MIHRRFDLKMSALLLSILGLSSVIPHCPMWKAIAPCSCRMDSTKLQSIYCEKMSSFDQIVNLFHGHFSPSDRISLSIALSSLDDLPRRSFKELNMSIENLKLNQDNIGWVKYYASRCTTILRKKLEIGGKFVLIKFKKSEFRIIAIKIILQLKNKYLFVAISSAIKYQIWKKKIVFV